MIKVITWNMQGAAGVAYSDKWSIIYNAMKKVGADICCVQECGTTP